MGILLWNFILKINEPTEKGKKRKKKERTRFLSSVLINCQGNCFTSFYINVKMNSIIHKWEHNHIRIFRFQACNEFMLQKLHCSMKNDNASEKDFLKWKEVRNDLVKSDFH